MSTVHCPPFAFCSSSHVGLIPYRNKHRVPLDPILVGVAILFHSPQNFSTVWKAKISKMGDFHSFWKEKAHLEWSSCSGPALWSSFILPPLCETVLILSLVALSTFLLLLVLCCGERLKISSVSAGASSVLLVVDESVFAMVEPTTNSYS